MVFPTKLYCITRMRNEHLSYVKRSNAELSSMHRTNIFHNTNSVDEDW